MKYIGNKTRVLDFIKDCLHKNNINYKNKKVADLFAGTGSVSNFFLQNGCEVLSCDNMTYSIVEQYRINYFKLEPDFVELNNIIHGKTLDDVLKHLNGLKGKKGYFYDNYAPSGKYNRQYFTDDNAMKIDSIRETIENWKKIIPTDKYYYLLGILMCAADKVSNTSGTYGAFLKIWRSMALKNIYLDKPSITSNGINYIYQDDVINFVKKFNGFDIVYLDPPYNKRQYASNFHVLESIVVFDKQQLKGKTGLRDYEHQKSDYCIKNKVAKAFEDLIININSKYIVMSYSTEGLLLQEEIENILNKRGKVNIYKNSYRRFKTNSWTDDKTGLEEIVFICEIY